MNRTIFGRSLGWIPDIPDLRDYTMEASEVRKALAAKPGGRRSRAPRRPARADLREWCPPVEDQGSLGSCTAHAGVGAIEYYERKAFGRHLEASRLFLYKVTRNLMNARGDTGAYLRTTMGAMVLFGVPPEGVWPYTDGAAFDREPTAFCYALAQNYQTLVYYRHDPPGTAPDALLDGLRERLAGGHPAMFGFTVYDSIEGASKDGRIPFPAPKEKVMGGHAVLAVGYDDALEIGRGAVARTKGALLIRNSWGPGWGEEGYGWLPYDYVRRGLAEDFWSIVKKEWIDSGCFGE